jgi:nicotinamidase/pyrazinamidase
MNLIKAFFDIDTQLDFMVPAGALYVPGAERLIPKVAELNRYAAAHGIPVISTMCAHTENAAEFKQWPPHCVAGTFGQLKPQSTLLEKRVVIPNAPCDIDVAGAQQIVVEKNELDVFSNPNFLPLLDKLGIDDYEVYGVLMDYCVGLAALGLLKTGRTVRLRREAIL